MYLSVFKKKILRMNKIMKNNNTAVKNIIFFWFWTLLIYKKRKKACEYWIKIWKSFYDVNMLFLYIFSFSFPCNSFVLIFFPFSFLLNMKILYFSNIRKSGVCWKYHTRNKKVLIFEVSKVQEIVISVSDEFYFF